MVASDASESGYSDASVSFTDEIGCDQTFFFFTYLTQ